MKRKETTMTFNRMKIAIWGLMAAALFLATPCHAQAQFPTIGPPILQANGVVPLQCDASNINCAPVTAANPVAMNGNVATGATDSGNPVKIGGRYNVTQPTLTDGQRGDAQVDIRGNLKATLYGADTVTPVSVGGGAIADAISNTQSGNVSTRSSPLMFNGTTWDRTRGDANGLVVQPGLTATFWSYTSGVTAILANTTTGVTIKAAAGASVRNYIDSCQLTTTAFGASVPLALRDGTGGTVRWALTVPIAGFLQPVTVNFSPALQGTANTLWEVATPTANTTGTVTLNCAGHTGV